MTLDEAVADVRRVLEHPYTTDVGESARLGALGTRLCHYRIDCLLLCRRLGVILSPIDRQSSGRACNALLHWIATRRRPKLPKKKAVGKRAPASVIWPRKSPKRGRSTSR